MCADTRSRRRAPAHDQIDVALAVFSMLADPTLVRLLWTLAQQEMSVNELAEAVGKPAAGVSQHLAKLRMAGLVRTRRQANRVFYRIENSHAGRLVEDAIHYTKPTTSPIPKD